ncbi:MAG: hypothetical protein PUP91_26560 [Rhizonema sp. PD37]|nr:hypothetical protein [Rhizonema sp. PD37]
MLIANSTHSWRTRARTDSYGGASTEGGFPSVGIWRWKPTLLSSVGKAVIRALILLRTVQCLLRFNKLIGL